MPGGRPKRQFTTEQIQQITEMALNNCNTETIANALEIPVNTLKRRFGRLLKQKRAEHRVTLRASQTKAAKAGNPAMLIFLGKNELKQVDKQVISTDNEQQRELTEKQVSEAKRIAAIRLRQEAG